MALGDALAETHYLSANWDEKRKRFINQLQGPDVTRSKTKVHAELAMVMAMEKGEITHALPYIGVSKLSCVMCIHYIGAFNEVMKQNITTRGSHRKVYPGWSWPIPPSHDEELRQAFLKGIRQQLLNDFVIEVESRRLSDSSVGSDPSRPEWDLDETNDEITALYNE